MITCTSLQARSRSLHNFLYNNSIVVYQYCIHCIGYVSVLYSLYWLCISTVFTTTCVSVLYSLYYMCISTVFTVLHVYLYCIHRIGCVSVQYPLDFMCICTVFTVLHVYLHCIHCIGCVMFQRKHDVTSCTYVHFVLSFSELDYHYVATSPAYDITQ